MNYAYTVPTPTILNFMFNIKSWNNIIIIFGVKSCIVWELSCVHVNLLYSILFYFYVVSICSFWTQNKSIHLDN